MTPINWSPIVEEYPNETKQFVLEETSLRNFINSVQGEARTQLYAAEKQYGTQKSRHLARRALNRRHLYV